MNAMKQRCMGVSFKYPPEKAAAQICRSSQSQKSAVETK
jgi:hypothetical protein